jgi:hypothetical protein
MVATCRADRRDDEIGEQRRKTEYNVLENLIREYRGKSSQSYHGGETYLAPSG